MRSCPRHGCRRPPGAAPPTGSATTATSGRTASTGSASTSRTSRKDRDLTDTATVHEITIRRVFDAPRALVWKAWAEPERPAPRGGEGGGGPPPRAVPVG